MQPLRRSGRRIPFQWDPQGSLVQRQTGGPGGNTSYYALDTAMYDRYGAKLGDTDAFTGGAEATRDAMGFQGQFGAYTDTETGLVLMGHRYYDAGTGRFLTRDPLGYGGGINLYGFTGNNPVNEMDPSGFGYEPIDEAVDLGFVAYDLGKVIYNGVTHASNGERALDAGALGLDLVGLIPGAPPGLGRGAVLVHAGIAANRAYRIAREARYSVKAAQVGVSFATASGNGGSGRTSHGDDRHAQGTRPTGAARNDAQKAKLSDLYIQDNGIYIVRGDNAREHFFFSNGLHDSSIVRSARQHLNLLRSGARHPANEEEFERFKALVK